GEVRVYGDVLGDEPHQGFRLERPRPHGPAEHLDPAPVRAQQPGDHRDRRRLSGAVRPQQPVCLALADAERDAVDGLQLAESSSEVFDHSDIGHGSPTCAISSLSAARWSASARRPSLVATIQVRGRRPSKVLWVSTYPASWRTDRCRLRFPSVTPSTSRRWVKSTFSASASTARIPRRTRWWTTSSSCRIGWPD